MDAHALLTSQGWRGTGNSLHPTSNNIGLSRPLLVSQKKDTLGVGKKQHRTSDMWWMNAFDTSLKGLDTSKEGQVVQTVTSGGLDMVAKGGGKWVGSKGGLYASFVRGESLSGTITPVEDGTESEGRERTSRKKRKVDDVEGKEKESKEERRARKAAKRAMRAAEIIVEEASPVRTQNSTPVLDEPDKDIATNETGEEAKDERKARRAAKRLLEAQNSASTSSNEEKSESKSTETKEERKERRRLKKLAQNSADTTESEKNKKKKKRKQEE